MHYRLPLSKHQINDNFLTNTFLLQQNGCFLSQVASTIVPLLCKGRSDLQRKREVGKGGRLIWHKLDRAKPVSEPDRSPCTQWPHRPTILPSAPKVLASLFWLVLKEGF